MVDVSAIAGTVSALKGAVDITKAMIGLRDAQLIQAKVIELNAKILEAQGSAFAANEERSALIEEIRTLKKEVTALKAWEAEKQRYQLSEVAAGVFAYTLKQGMENGEPSHMLCANCYQNGEKGFLQATQELVARHRIHRCSKCRTEAQMGHVPRPQMPTRANTSFDPFTGR
jgi:hypothetical protein